MSPKDSQPSDARNGLPIREPAARAHESSTNQNPPVESSDESPVEELFSFAADFASKGGLKRLKSLRQDNERLKQDNINLRATNKENLGAYSESRDQWHAEKREFLSQLDEQKQIHETLCNEQKKNRQLGDQMQALDNSVLQLVQANKAGEARIQQLTTQEVKNKETIDQETNRRTQLQHQLGELDKQLRTRDERLLAAEKNLAVVRAFLVQLVPLEKKQPQLREALEDMFNAALAFFQQTLGQDLGTNVLTRSNPRTYLHGLDLLPLPLSNTPVAKHMRAVAGLVALSKALRENVFRPTYIMHSPELDGVLSDTAEHDPRQEAFIRAVLLKALPNEQREIREACVNQAVHQVSDALAHWIQDKEAFEAGLRQVCQKASITWTLIQLIEERVWPDLATREPGDWCTLPLPSTQPAVVTTKPSSSKQVPSKKKPQDRQQPSMSNASGQTSAALGTADVARVIWPAFLATDPNEPDVASPGPQDLLVYHGYALTLAQLKAAEDELYEASQKAGSRSMRRTDSISTRKRRDSAVYVDNGDVDGPSMK